MGDELEARFQEQIERSFEAFQSRRIHRRLTPAILASIPDDRLEQAVIDFVFEKTGDRDEAEIVRRLSAGFRAVHATWVLEAEVNNGGFNQFFFNSSGQFAEDAVAGFDSWEGTSSPS